MTALIDTLFQLEKQLGLELDSLLPFAEQDDIGGYHPDASQAKWGAGAIWDVEGRTLYALIRALQPRVIVEIGSGTGCSTTHMAQALADNAVTNDYLGHITTIDRGNTPQVPGDLKRYVDIRGEDAINYLALAPDNSIDFILEDADHSEALCHTIGELAKTKLKPGGLLMAHDAAHFGVGRDVKAGYDLAGLDFRVYLTDPSDCGWLVWMRPQTEYAPFTTIADVQNGVELLTTVLRDDKSTEEKLAGFALDAQPVLQAQEDYPTDQREVKPPPEKVKRTRKPKAKPSK